MSDEDDTFEVPVAVALQKMDPIIDPNGVTRVVVLAISTVEGVTRRFVLSTDDLNKIIEIFQGAV